MKTFLYAFRGIGATIRGERNMRIHLTVSFYVILGGLITGISQLQWLAVLLCIAVVTALECMNTALERLCDEVHPGRSEGIRLAKDAAAGGVLSAAIISALVGGLIFFSKQSVTAALNFAKENKQLSAVLILSLIPAVFLIRGKKRT